jgi:hypothetical protein
MSIRPECFMKEEEEKEEDIRSLQLKGGDACTFS